MSIIFIDKLRLRNIYKVSCIDLICFFSYLIVYIKCWVYLYGSGMDLKNLKAAKLYVFFVRSIDGTGEVFF